MNEELENLITDYKKLAIAYGEAIDGPDNKEVARSIKKMKRLLINLKSHNEDAHQALFSLLDHENKYIRYLSAFNLIRKDKEKSLEVLQQIMDSEKGFLSGFAEMTLSISATGGLEDSNDDEVFF